MFEGKTHPGGVTLGRRRWGSAMARWFVVEPERAENISLSSEVEAARSR